MLFLVKIFAFSLAWIFVQSNNQREKLFMFQKSSSGEDETFLVVTWAESEDNIGSGCEIFKDKDLIHEVLESSYDSPIRAVTDDDEMQNLLEDCTEFILRRRRRGTDEENEHENVLLDGILDDPAELARTRPSGRQNRRGGRGRSQGTRTARRKSTTLSSKIKATTESPTTQPTTESPTTLGYKGYPIIYPGTKWCGAGSTAKNYTELGGYVGADECCRTHDHCNDTLAPGETRHNLTNTSLYTKLSCECDLEFHNCLSRLNTFPANSIGNIYFNLLRRDCYMKEYPFTNNCKSYLTLFKITCMEYERNRTAPKVYQWIPAQRYTLVGK